MATTSLWRIKGRVERLLNWHKHNRHIGYSGKKLYNKDVAVVMTNSVFTIQATDDAMKLGVKLWDGNRLEHLREQANEGYLQ